jgi:hypothetical protein
VGSLVFIGSNIYYGRHLVHAANQSPYLLVGYREWRDDEQTRDYAYSSFSVMKNSQKVVVQLLINGEFRWIRSAIHSIEIIQKVEEGGGCLA